MHWSQRCFDKSTELLCVPSQVEELVASTVATYGGVDILVANAGIVRAADFLDMSEQDFDDVIRVNLKGTFLVRRLLPAYQEPLSASVVFK